MMLAISLAPRPSITASAAWLAQVPKETALASPTSVSGTEVAESTKEGTVKVGTTATALNSGREACVFRGTAKAQLLNV